MSSNTRCNPLWVWRVLDHGIGRGLQLGEIEAAVAQLELHGKAAGIADALDRRRREHDDARLLDRRERRG